MASACWYRFSASSYLPLIWTTVAKAFKVSATRGSVLRKSSAKAAAERKHCSASAYRAWSRSFLTSLTRFYQLAWAGAVSPFAISACGKALVIDCPAESARRVAAPKTLTSSRSVVATFGPERIERLLMIPPKTVVRNLRLSLRIPCH